MPTWGQILNELKNTPAPQGSGWDYDGVRRKYLRQLHELTGRAVIIYYSSYFESRPAPPADLQIGLQDITGFMEAASNVKEKELDLIIHSPGGSAEAAESIVTYLRKRFDNIRIIVPIAAMSAATMVALSANEIVMGEHSQLGPIDPQFTIQTPEGPRSAPAKAILNQFELAKTECKDPANLAAWMPILRGYLPGLLALCQDSSILAATMVSSWLENYMFTGDPQAKQKAKEIADWFADYESFQTHGRRVSPDEAIAKGLKVVWLESDPNLQDAVLSVHHATAHTFTGTPSTKIIENHHGRAWIKMNNPILVPAPMQAPVPAGGAPQLSRADRRRATKGRK